MPNNVLSNSSLSDETKYKHRKKVCTNLDTSYTASFEQVLESSLILEFAEALNNDDLKTHVQHYIFHTYDDVIEIVAEEFEITLKI